MLLFRGHESLYNGTPALPQESQGRRNAAQGCADRDTKDAARTLAILAFLATLNPVSPTSRPWAEPGRDVPHSVPRARRAISAPGAISACDDDVLLMA